MNNKHYIGRAVHSLEHYDKVGPITGVSILVDENNEYVAGDMTGYVFETTCPYGTQAMANAMLASLQGKVYKGFRATDAILDKDAELGDGITIDGEYAMLAYQEITFGPKHTSEIAAPGESILEHEYPYVGSTQKTINRKIAQVNSKITKTSEEIMLEVSKELNGLSSSLSVQVDSITSKVESSVPYSSATDPSNSWTDEEKTGNVGYLWYDTSNKVLKKWDGTSWVNSPTDSWAGAMSIVKQTVDSLTLSVSNGETSSNIKLMAGSTVISSKTIKFTGNVVFASDLTDGQTTISGDNILTGTIETARIKLSGKMKVYDDNDNIGGYIGYMSGADLSGSSTDGIAMKNGRNVIIATDAGARMTSSGAEVICVNNVSLNSDYSVVVDAVNFKSNVSLTVTSDRNLKDEILYDVADKYLPLFDRLSPASFLYKGRAAGRHLGFIAQDVEAAAAECGIDKSDLALLVQDEDGLYGLSYSEFIPILVAKIKDLETRLEGLST